MSRAVWIAALCLTVCACSDDGGSAVADASDGAARDGRSGDGALPSGDGATDVRVPTADGRTGDGQVGGDGSTPQPDSSAADSIAADGSGDAPAPQSDGANPQPDAGASLSALDDDFNNAQTMSSWINLYPARLTTLDIGSSAAGRLTMVPVAQTNNAWYSDSRGPLLYKLVTGNFVVEASVRIGRTSNPALPPTGQFNAAGFVIRDPASSNPGGERWVMYNIGYQDSAVARETKTTRAASGSSLSTLYLNNTPSASTSAILRVCRVGNTFHFFHRHGSASSFTAEPYAASTRISGNGAAQVTPGTTLGSPIQFTRTDMPATLQVGLMTGTWAAPHDARGEFDWARFARVNSLADCTQPLP
ncbi:MAG: hypothetical protein KC503_24090 [Myxococcales bacterium]|nr:hypothetical protein [Myxococcales bacterium]